MDCRPPGSSVHGISQARILQWVPFPSLGDPPNPGIKPMSPALAGGFYITEPPGKPILWRPQTKSWLPSLPQNTVTTGKPRLHLVSLLAPEWPLVCHCPNSSQVRQWGPRPSIMFSTLSSGTGCRFPAERPTGRHSIHALVQSSGRSYGLTSPSTCTSCPHLLLCEERDTFRNLLSSPHACFWGPPRSHNMKFLPRGDTIKMTS